MAAQRVTQQRSMASCHHARQGMPSQFGPGASVEYFSQSQQRWIPALVKSSDQVCMLRYQNACMTDRTVSQRAHFSKGCMIRKQNTYMTDTRNFKAQISKRANV
eukprot:5776137-Amphidinium_carterae.1